MKRILLVLLASLAAWPAAANATSCSGDTISVSPGERMTVYVFDQGYEVDGYASGTSASCMPGETVSHLTITGGSTGPELVEVVGRAFLPDVDVDLGGGGADELQLASGAAYAATIGTSGVTASGLAASWTADIATVGISHFTLYGSGYADQLTGGPGDDRIEGGGGADVIDGAGGNDQLFGGRGRDTVTGGAGDDLLSGGKGRDTLYGADGVTGNDELRGGPGADAGTADDGDVVRNVETLN